MARNRFSALVNREPSAAIAPRRPPRNPDPPRAWRPALVTVAEAQWLRRWLPGWLTRWLREGIPPSIAYTGAGAGAGTGAGILPLPPRASGARTGSTRKEFSPFLVSRCGARLEHSREALGTPFLEIALRGDHELGGVGLGAKTARRITRLLTLAISRFPSLIRPPDSVPR